MAQTQAINAGRCPMCKERAVLFYPHVDATADNRGYVVGSFECVACGFASAGGFDSGAYHEAVRDE